MKTEQAMRKKSEQLVESQDWNRCLSELGRTGDRQLYLQFYQYFAPRLNAWLQGVTRDPVMAEELVQDTMLAVWNKAAKYDARKAAASTWVYRIARNLHIDQLRRAQVRERSKAKLVEDDTGFDDHLSDAERVRDALRQLPVLQAQVVYKSYFEGKSHQEIANEIGMPLGSVKSNLRLAFQKLSRSIRP